MRFIEIAVGLFMLLFIIAMSALALRISHLAGFGSNSGYEVTASFENVGGLKVRSPVSASGVLVGSVTDIRYNDEDYNATVTLKIDDEFSSFPLDTTASIYTAGLLGAKYIGLEPGSDPDYLKDGEEIELTQSAVVLEKLISQFVLNSSGEKE